MIRAIRNVRAFFVGFFAISLFAVSLDAFAQPDKVLIFTSEASARAHIDANRATLVQWTSFSYSYNGGSYRGYQVKECIGGIDDGKYTQSSFYHCTHSTIGGTGSYLVYTLWPSSGNSCPIGTVEIGGGQCGEPQECTELSGSAFATSTNPNLNWDGSYCCLARNDGSLGDFGQQGYTLVKGYWDIATQTVVSPAITYYYEYTGATCTSGDSNTAPPPDVQEPFTSQLPDSDVFSYYPDSLSANCPDGQSFGTVEVGATQYQGCFGSQYDQQEVDYCDDGKCGSYADSNLTGLDDPNSLECNIDTDGDGTPDCYDIDSDGDGVPNVDDPDSSVFVPSSNTPTGSEDVTPVEACDPAVDANCSQSSSVAISGGLSCSSPPIWSGEESERDEYVTAYHTWRQSCQVDQIANARPSDFGVNSVPDNWTIQDIQIQDDGSDLFDKVLQVDDGSALACPEGYSMDLFGQTFTLSYQPMCDLADMLRPLLLFLTSLICLLLAYRGVS